MDLAQYKWIFQTWFRLYLPNTERNTNPSAHTLPSYEKKDKIPKLFFLPFPKIDSVTGRINAPSKDVHILIPKTCEYAAFHGTRDFASVIKLRVLRWGGYSGVSGWASCNHSFLWERGRRVSQRKRHSDSSRDQSDKGSWVEECGQPPEKGRKWILPQSLRKECSPAKSFSTSDLQNS